MIQIEAELGDVPHVQGDPYTLQEVLFNLCTNAIRHSPEFNGSPVVRLTMHPATDGCPACLDVADSGGGIAPKLEEQVFEPFFTTEHKGTGLGLYLARELCEVNGARLEYLRRPQGACFRIRFADAEHSAAA